LRVTRPGRCAGTTRRGRTGNDASPAGNRNDIMGTKMKKNLAAVIVAAAMLAAPLTGAADSAAPVNDLQAMQKAVKADKRAYVASVLDLTPAEAKKFWPIYDAYQLDIDMANRKRSVALEGLIARDRPLSDLYAKQLANELIAADETEVRARRKMQNKLMRALPPKKAARYLQVESQIRAMQLYGIAEAFPLVR
jgi:Spy/CpxP family protein refolding chaperone